MVQIQQILSEQKNSQKIYSRSFERSIKKQSLKLRMRILLLKIRIKDKDRVRGMEVADMGDSRDKDKDKDRVDSRRIRMRLMEDTRLMLLSML